jgi:hypothetical protein
VITRAPRLATAVLWAASRDEAMVVEHLVGLGRRQGAPGLSQGRARDTRLPARHPDACRTGIARKMNRMAC